MSEASAAWMSPLLELLFEEPSVGRCLVAPDGRVLRANGAWLHSIGLSLEGVIGADIVDLLPEPRDQALALQARARAGQKVELPRYAQVAGGGVAWWEGSLEPVPLGGGVGLLLTARLAPAPTRAASDPAGASRIARDASRRREVAPSLESTSQRFYAILSTMNVGVLLVTNEGRVEFANQAICRDFGLDVPPGHLVGLSAADLMEQARPAYREPDAAFARIREIVARGAPVEDEEVALRDGRTCLRDFIPLTVNGRPSGRLWTHVDVTERRRSGAALRRAEERYRGYFDSLAEAVVVLDAVRDGSGAVVDWRCAASNTAHQRLFGLAARDIVGALMSQVMGRGWLERLHERNCRVLATGERVTDEMELRGRRLASTVLRIDAETLAVAALDVTARRQAEEALRESDRRKTEFLAILSHELRNPLAPICNSIQLLDHAPTGSAAALRAREVLHRQTEHLTRLVDDLLDITRITHGKIELRLDRLDAREVVRRSCDDLRGQYEQHGISLECSEGPDPAWVESDEPRLAQIMGNLLSNALKFTPSGGRVQVEVRLRDESCEVSVRDSGMGIEEADLERIFEPFVQSRQTRRHTHGGLGIGLALVRQLVLQHQGTVHATSAGPGLGSEFLMRLPRSARPPARPVGPDSPDGGGLSILVVEDNADAGASLADLLELDGHQVKVVATGRDGIEAMSAHPPDVLICDIGLPDLSGHEVIRAARAAGSRAWAIALTGYAQPEDREQALKAGFDAHLAKPPPLEELGALLVRATKRKG